MGFFNLVFSKFPLTWCVIVSSWWIGWNDAGHLTPKSDVYSFGVVLLELLSGRRALDEDRGGLAEQTLVEWADPFLRDSRRVLRIMDTRLGGQYSKKEAQAVAAVVLQCLHMDPKNRPSMVDVLTSLEQLHTSKDMPRTPPPAKLHHHHHHHNHHQGIKHTNPPRKTSVTNSKWTVHFLPHMK